MKDDTNIFVNVNNTKNYMERINYYSSEEQKSLGKIADGLKKIKNFYSSPNSGGFDEVSRSITNSKSKIGAKRDYYNKVLKRNSEVYLSASKEAIAMLKDGGKHV